MEYLAMAVAVISLGLGVYTALGPLSKMNAAIPRLELSADTGLMLGRISTVTWDIFELQVQKEACFYQRSEYPVIQESDGTYKLTGMGESLITPKLRDIIVGIRHEAGGKTEDVILKLGVYDLIKEAQAQKVPPGVMMGTVITYLQES